jgi:Cu-Zn family superoxide dismutase
MAQPIRLLLLSGVIALFSQTTVASYATAVLSSVDGNPVGTVKLHQSPYGTLLKVELYSMSAGVNAFHIHEIGQCDPSFGHAGGHYNPESTGHGFMDNDGVHAGDMPNLHIPASGDLKFEVFNPLVKLDERLFDEDGASIMIHAGADDYVSNPAGDAGSRIACGVIERNQ